MLDLTHLTLGMLATVARSHRGFPAKSRQRFGQIRKNSELLYIFFFWGGGMGRKILKFDPFQKQETVRHNLSASFRPPLAKIGGRTEEYFLQPQLSYFAEFSAIWQQCWLPASCSWHW